MCGLAAFFAYSSDSPPLNFAEMTRVTNAMAKRGPDGEGCWSGLEGRILLGHRRLSIIELNDRGAQPMTSIDGNAAIVFNGEIYNFRELRHQLEGRGVRFRSQSDTEVILEGYRLDGPAFLNQLRGMFAIALWDGANRGILVARDGLGIKPLYVADDGRTLRIASQVKALLAGGNIDTSPDPAGHAGFFLWGHVPEPHTLYRGIRAVKPGTWEWWDLDGRRKGGTFFNLGVELRTAPAAPTIGLKEALEDSVAHHLIADVPVGVFLSAGRDSTTLAAMASRRASEGLLSVTLAFDEFRNTSHDEAPLAELAARHYRTRHSTIRIPGSEFAAQRNQILMDMDQPTIDGVNVWFVARAAAQCGLKVALSGLGGDELFAGYNSFRTVPRMAAFLGPFGRAPWLGRTARRLLALPAARLGRPKLAGVLELGTTIPDAYLLRRGLFMPWELGAVLDPEMARDGLEALAPRLSLAAAVEGISNPTLAISALEMQFYMQNQLLRDADWAGMAHSLEIRVPFVDTSLLRAVLALRAAGYGPSKADMANCAEPALPSDIADRPKTGFFIPVASWLGEPSLRGWAKRVYDASLQSCSP